MLEVASLDPQPAAVPTSDGVEPPLRGKPQPGLRDEMLAAFVEVALKHQKLAAVRKIERIRVRTSIDGTSAGRRTNALAAPMPHADTVKCDMTV